ncbi:uncharacterized protein RCO7_05410 [Rhynchosporium graminicola]|uniref:Uncharacterized protein n=1 Tax=Rhynchosporium graminicola TaxID=2792576 RepID=A0A1E1KUU9_9HELO|nr:uncharacterized protein RCO7_05410 [Rhynchosporium commune]
MPANPGNSKLAISTIPEIDEYDEDYDNFDSMTALVPLGTAPRNAKTSSSGKESWSLVSKTRVSNTRVLDSVVYHDAAESFSYESSGSKDKSILQSAYFKDPSKAPAGKSVLQSSFFKDKPKPSREKSTMPSFPIKDDPKSPRVKTLMPSARARDAPQSTRMKSAMPSITFDPSELKNYMTTKVDKAMSRRQTSYATLPPKEQAKQLVWAVEKIDEIAPCPDQYAWKRVDQDGWGGFVCSAGAHAMLDQHLAEGRGAILILGVLKQLGSEGAQRCGPWYPHPTIANCHIWIPGTEVQGVRFYDHPSFFGSGKQRARAKWEYYSSNPDTALMDRMNYEFPEQVPPQEWEFAKDEPKP